MRRGARQRCLPPRIRLFPFFSIAHITSSFSNTKTLCAVGIGLKLSTQQVRPPLKPKTPACKQVHICIKQKREIRAAENEKEINPGSFSLKPKKDETVKLKKSIVDFH